MTRARSILYGTLVVGSLDAIDAVVFLGLLRGSTPIQVFQGIASGWLGRASFSGGLPTAALGVLTHYVIAFMIVETYSVCSSRFPVLARRPAPSGVLYGLLVYSVMNRVVIALSAIGAVRFSLPPFINGMLIHAFGVGLPSALFAARSHTGATDQGRALSPGGDSVGS